MRAATLGIGSVLAAATAITISLYATAHAQGTAQAGPPPAGPRGITGAQEVQQAPRPAAGQVGQFFGGGAIAADQGVVYVLRGNLLLAVSGAANGGKMRVLDRIELPGPNRPENPFRQPGQPVPPGNRQQGNGGAPSKGG
ncbi:MAG TPA: hypothetical protein VMI31_15205 [Fimbriimonadaceae bacterium]|nr:hypothetical protein [Fimbriimonadaceae bacterium]